MKFSFYKEGRLTYNHKAIATILVREKRLSSLHWYKLFEY